MGVLEILFMMALLTRRKKFNCHAVQSRKEGRISSIRPIQHKIFKIQIQKISSIKNKNSK